MNIVYRESMIADIPLFRKEIGSILTNGKYWGDKLIKGERFYWINEDKVNTGLKGVIRSHGLPLWEDNTDDPDTSTGNNNNDTNTEVKEKVMSDFTHYTGPDNRRYVRVSTVIDIVKSPGLSQFRERVGTDAANKMMKDAADWGTEVHDVTAAIDNGKGDVDIPDRSFNMVMRYLSWRDRWVEKILFVEKTFFSKEYGFACTIDRGVIIKHNTVPQLVDLKTGTINKKKFGLQLSGYKIAAKENGIDTGKALILPLDKKNNDADDLEPIRLDANDEEEYKQAFLDALGLYRYMSGEKWK